MGWLAGIGIWVAKKTVPVWSLAIAFLLGVAVANSAAISKLIKNQDQKVEALAQSVEKQYDAGVKDIGKRQEREGIVDKKTESDAKKIDGLPPQPGCKIPADFFRMLNGANE